MELVLSLFTGAGLLDRGFREEGFCVVSAGDIVTGQDVREFTPARHVFAGIIGGSPCQEFSKAFRGVPTGYSQKLFEEFLRVVRHAAPKWFLLENVPQVPDAKIDGYTVQRFNINASECGVPQNRLRCIQFGSLDASRLAVQRDAAIDASQIERCVLASEGRRKDHREFSRACELQGLPPDFLSGSELPLWLKFQLVGNGVPVPLARALARAVKQRQETKWAAQYCVCGCGRTVRPGRTQAAPQCRKRLERQRKKLAAKNVTIPGQVTKLPLFPKLKFSTEQLLLT